MRKYKHLVVAFGELSFDELFRQNIFYQYHQYHQCFSSYLQNFTEKGIQILGSDVKIERSESHWKIHGTLTVVEDITKSSPIPEDQEEIQTLDEHH